MSDRLRRLYLFATHALRSGDGHLSFTKLVLLAVIALRALAKDGVTTTDAFLFIAASYGWKGVSAVLARWTGASTSTSTATSTRTVTEQIQTRRAQALDGSYEVTP